MQKKKTTTTMHHFNNCTLNPRNTRRQEGGHVTSHVTCSKPPPPSLLQHFVHLHCVFRTTHPISSKAGTAFPPLTLTLTLTPPLVAEMKASNKMCPQNEVINNNPQNMSSFICVRFFFVVEPCCVGHNICSSVFMSETNQISFRVHEQHESHNHCRLI